MAATDDFFNIWIYHERQEARLCGQHALNNLAQRPVYTAHGLAAIAHRLDQLELDVYRDDPHEYSQRRAQGSVNVDAQGNFSIQVLNVALQNEYGLQLNHFSPIDHAQNDIATYQGFLCHKSDHWFGLRNIGGRFWNLNSMLELPVTVSHFKLATEMETWRGQGYTIFAVPAGLPEAGHKLGTANWHRMSDVIRGRTTQPDPFAKLGFGLRLDGGSSGVNSVAGSFGRASPVSIGQHVVDGMTEEEQLQLALQESLQARNGRGEPTVMDVIDVDVPPEPDPSSPGVVRVQVRLPNGKRVVRRFDSSDPVQVLYGFILQELGRTSFQVKFGFPPQDLRSRLHESIADVGLANQSVQAIFV